MFPQEVASKVALKIEKERRFPEVDYQLPDVSAATTTLTLTENDAEFLTRAAKRLPGAGEMNAPVTLDLNGAVVVRAKSDEQQSPTDLILRNSQRCGDELRIGSNRNFLSRAIQLGFRDIHFQGSDAPAFCRNGRRSYLWALLGNEAVLKPNADAIRIESPIADQPVPAPNRNRVLRVNTLSPPHQPPREQSSVKKNQSEETNSPPLESTRNEATTATNLIEETQSLQLTLREALSKTNALLLGLKRQRQQSKLMRSALQSLRAVQVIES